MVPTMAGGSTEAAASALDTAQFRALAETTPDAIVMGDPAGRIAYVNPAAERLLRPSARCRWSAGPSA
jgi:PAS domain-containing protein